jgi:hypothetical protein
MTTPSSIIRLLFTSINLDDTQMVERDWNFVFFNNPLGITFKVWCKSNKINNYLVRIWDGRFTRV